jgi:16S rRNA (uracil1498-N3)-methyltransferase
MEYKKTLKCHHFFVDSSFVLHEEFELPPMVMHHCIHVLRCKPKDLLILFNGDGYYYHAIIAQINKKNVFVTLLKKTSPSNESPLSIHLYQSIAKGDKMDWIIQKSIELGVHDLTPIFTDYCNVKLDSKRLQKKWNHWKNIAIRACEQSGRAVVPKIHTPISMNTIEFKNQSVYYLDPRGSHSIQTLKRTLSLDIIIGPEGGFSLNDYHFFNEKKIQGIHMGSRILRTETASLSALAIFQSLYGDM